MAYQEINIGTSANDGTGDTLRAAGEKINENFEELYDAVALEYETLTANGNASLTVGFSIINKATAIAIGLNNGSRVGHLKYIVNKGAGTATVTPSNFLTGTTITLTQGEGVHLIWDGNKWYAVGTTGTIA